MNEYKITDKMHSWQKTYPVWVSALSVIVLLIIWELICRAGIVSPLFLPSPTGILSALADMVAGGEIAVSLAASMYRIVLGFVLGSVIGLAVGLLYHAAKRTRHTWFWLFIVSFFGKIIHSFMHM